MRGSGIEAGPEGDRHSLQAIAPSRLRLRAAQPFFSWRPAPENGGGGVTGIYW